MFDLPLLHNTSAFYFINLNILFHNCILLYIVLYCLLHSKYLVKNIIILGFVAQAKHLCSAFE